MGQVPANTIYTIIGDGRAARHFSHYLSLLPLPYRQWSRSSSVDLADVVNGSSIVLLLISDASIEAFVKSHPCLAEKTCVHFSGSLVTDVAYGAHPLMTFGMDLYSLEQYQKIPWILDDSAPPFEDLFPGLSNPHFRIQQSKKSYYHALCVMSNNFTTLLWQKFFDSLEDEFHIPKAHSLAIFEQTMKNIAENHKAALTGPLVRGDQETINENLAALSNDAFYEVYRSFVTAYREENTK